MFALLMTYIKFTLAIFLPLLGPLLSWAQKPPPSQIELNGFLLGQYVKAADATFGQPYEVRKADDHSNYRVYFFDKQHSGYMVFQASSDTGNPVVSIQVAGETGTPMRPFLGLVLGDERAKILQLLGHPSEIEHEKDYAADLYTYADRNYSFEVNPKGKLSSIRISGSEGFAKDVPSGFPDIETLRKAINDRNIDVLLSVFAGDLEIYKGDRTYDFARSARAELQDQNSEVSRLLFGEDKSLRHAFTTEQFDPDMQLRVYEKAAPGSVAKFEHSKIVKEVVYKFEAGAWRVYEIQLR